MKLFVKFGILLIVSLIGYISGAAVTKFPNANGSVTYSNARVLAKNEIFDGQLKRFDRQSRIRFSGSGFMFVCYAGGACKNQKEGGEKDAVFILESGATLKNVIIGANQAEGNVIICNTSCHSYLIFRSSLSRSM
jgi:hypothetical protein